MKSTFHSCMGRAIDQEVRRLISQVQGHMDIIKQIYTLGDAPIALKNRVLRPDRVIKYRRIYCPLVAFVVAWSQESEDIKAQALEFIRETKGQTQTVITDGIGFRRNVRQVGSHSREHWD
ncbi:hypothetical protein F5Y09DRAFT_319483 [Xylaria sp. FL1042]|nr:hypothetical protein F5Y09DRAFT_319483 [Xylaria sp. FL1042]